CLGYLQCIDRLDVVFDRVLTAVHHSVEVEEHTVDAGAPRFIAGVEWGFTVEHRGLRLSHFAVRARSRPGCQDLRIRCRPPLALAGYRGPSSPLPHARVR